MAFNLNPQCPFLSLDKMRLGPSSLGHQREAARERVLMASLTHHDASSSLTEFNELSHAFRV